MKKDTFIKGAFISTLCIILSKILGIVYVIPFHIIIDDEAGALYGYAYNIYALFLQLSTVGIPLAISKMVSEYNALEYHDAKRRTYKQAVIITSITALLSTLILYFFANNIAYLIKGGVVGGNSLEDIAFVIRVSSSAIFFVTMLSNIRGFLQGQKFIKDSSVSQVLEQFVRVITIIFGSYIFVRLFGTKEAVAVAIFGATLGAIAALIYLFIKGKDELKLNDKDYVLKEEEKRITNKELVKKLIKYTIPFVILSVIVSLYISVDMFTIIKTLVNNIGMNAKDAEYIMSCISTWGAKLNIIVTSISSGIVVSLLPNITSDFTKKNYKGIETKVIKTIAIIGVLVIPMVAGLSFLAEPVWTVFYGNNKLGISVFTFSIFTALFSGLYTNVNVIMQSVSRYKIVYVSLISGILFKIIMNVPLIILFNHIGLKPYYGSVTATIIGYVISILISLIDLKKTFKINYEKVLKLMLSSTFTTILMLIILSLIKYIVPITDLSKIMSFVVIILYATLGMIIYGVIMIKNKSFNQIFEEEIKKIKQKLGRK